jgi:hypothetical protein
LNRSNKVVEALGSNAEESATGKDPTGALADELALIEIAAGIELFHDKEP